MSIALQPARKSERSFRRSSRTTRCGAVSPTSRGEWLPHSGDTVGWQVAPIHPLFFVWLTILPFSGRREREPAGRPTARPPATAG
jgi:hypothetical protein